MQSSNTTSRMTRRAFIAGSIIASGLAMARAGDLYRAASSRSIDDESQPAEETPVSVDMLSYFIKSRSESLTGSHLLAQSLDTRARHSYYVKGDSTRYELHTWDDNHIYLVLDRDPDRTYGIRPGIWMKRVMAVGEEIIVPRESRIVWFNQSCAMQKVELYDYTMRLERYLPRFDAGGDLGEQDVVVLRYTPAGGNPERFYYSRAWGWIRWEEYEPNGSLRHRTVFNRIIRKSVSPILAQGCILDATRHLVQERR